MTPETEGGKSQLATASQSLLICSPTPVRLVAKPTISPAPTQPEAAVAAAPSTATPANAGAAAAAADTAAVATAYTATSATALAMSANALVWISSSSFLAAQISAMAIVHCVR